MSLEDFKGNELEIYLRYKYKSKKKKHIPTNKYNMNIKKKNS